MHVLVAGAVRRRDAAGALGRDLRVVVEVAGKRRIEGAPPVALRRRERRGREAAERGAAHALVLGENCAARSFRIGPRKCNSCRAEACATPPGQGPQRARRGPAPG